MAEIEVTIPEELIQGLFTSDDGMKHLVENVVEQILEAEMTEFLQAEKHEQTDNRQGYRNGTRDREMTARVGSLDLEVPRDRDGNFSTVLFDRLQRNEQALEASLMEMVVNGVSTRRVKNITQKLCGTEFSKSTVSDLCEGLDERINTWNNRELTKDYPFVLVDAMTIRIRRPDHVVRQSSMLIVVGINEEGRREVLGLKVAEAESKPSWMETFRWLKDRKLSGVEFVVSDSHRGLKEAVRQCFEGAQWQRCQEHFKRNLKDKVPTEYWDEFKEALDTVFKANNPEEARDNFNEMADDFEGLADNALEALEAGLEDAIQVLYLPDKYRRRLRTTNMIERLIEEARRREKVIRIFHGEQSALRIIGAYLQEIHDKWLTGRRYLNMDKFYEWKQATNQDTSESLLAAE